CRVEDLDLADGRLRGVATSSGYLPASVVVLAIGHSARDTYEMLVRRGVPMVQKPFQFGVRIEQPQETVNRVHYGTTRLEDRLGYLCPIQRAADFLANRPTDTVPPNSYLRGAIAASIADLVPPQVVEALRHGLPIMDQRWNGRFLAEATLVGPESRGSAPVR